MSKILTHEQVAHRCEVMSQLCLGAMRKSLALIPQQVIDAAWGDEVTLPPLYREWLAALARDARISTQVQAEGIMQDAWNLLRSMWHPYSTSIPYARELQHLLGSKVEDILTSASWLCWHHLEPVVFRQDDVPLGGHITYHIETASQYWRGHVTFFVLRNMIHAAPPKLATTTRATNQPLSIIAGYWQYMAPVDGSPLNAWQEHIKSYCMEIGTEEQEMSWENRLQIAGKGEQA